MFLQEFRPSQELIKKDSTVGNMSFLHVGHGLYFAQVDWTWTFKWLDFCGFFVPSSLLYFFDTLMTPCDLLRAFKSNPQNISE